MLKTLFTCYIATSLILFDLFIIDQGPVSQRFPRMFPKIDLKICLSYNIGSS